MQVMGDEPRLDIEEAPEMLDAVGEGPQRLGVLQIADVMRDERIIALGQAERFFSSAPQASTGRGNRRRIRIGSGT